MSPETKFPSPEMPEMEQPRLFNPDFDIPEKTGEYHRLFGNALGSLALDGVVSLVGELRSKFENLEVKSRFENFASNIRSRFKRNKNQTDDVSENFPQEDLDRPRLFDPASGDLNPTALPSLESSGRKYAKGELFPVDKAKRFEFIDLPVGPSIRKIATKLGDVSIEYDSKPLLVPAGTNENQPAIEREIKKAHLIEKIKREEGEKNTQWSPSKPKVHAPRERVQPKRERSPGKQTAPVTRKAKSVSKAEQERARKAVEENARRTALDL
jgi:hypothetical protein